jgi:DNA-binding MarR family transcriptional regulator
MNSRIRVDARVAAVRRFNRFYTRQIGVLSRGFLGTEFSLAEGRVLYELAHRQQPTAAAVGAELGLDPGYLSRILRSFKKARLIRTRSSTSDARETLLSLTPRGRKAIAALDARSNKEVTARLKSVPETSKRSLVGAMGTIEQILAPTTVQKEPYILRAPQVGDMGWVAHRQGILYS